VRVLYINPMDEGTNAAIDALALSLNHWLAEGGVELRLVYADFNRPEWRETSRAAIEQAIEAGVDGIVAYVLDPRPPHPLTEPIARARAAGIPVFTFERPPFETDGSVVYPNFNHGLLIAAEMAELVGPDGRVSVISGPDIADDVELVLGILHGLENAGVELLNDPTEDRWKNHTDVSPEGRRLAHQLLAEIPSMDGLIVYNDETTLGVLEALAEAGRLGEFPILSRNGTPKVVDAVRRGDCAGTWDSDTPAIGRTMADLVLRRLVEGEDTAGEIVISPLGRMVSRSTLHRYTSLLERVPVRPLRVGLD